MISCGSSKIPMSLLAHERVGEVRRRHEVLFDRAL
jgi:hypothetical protein